MAENDKEIKIGIRTEADTSGAEKAEEAIKKVEDAAEKAGGGAGDPAAAAAQRDLAAATREGADAMRESNDAGDDMADIFAQLDALKAQATAATDQLAESTGGLTREEREAAAQAELLAAKIEQIEFQSRRLVAVELARGLNEVSQSFRGISPELDQAITGVSNFMNTFAATGDPIKATVALIVGEIGNMITALRDLDAYNAETTRRQKEGLEGVKKARAEVVAQIRAENMSAFFDQETQAIERQIAALNRQQRVVDAQREAEAAVGQARQAAGAANARPGQALPSALDNEVAGKFSDVTGELQKLADSVANANKTLQLERDLLTNAQQRADESAMREGDGGTNAMKDAAAAEQAKARVADLEEEVNTIALVAAAQQQKILADASVAFTGLGEESKAGFTDLARNLEAEIKAEAQAAGGQLSASARAAMQSLQTILADGVVKPDEIEALRTIAGLAKSSRESADNVIISGFQAMVARNQATEKRIADILKQLSERGATGE
jgi:hypothetical protein